MGNKFETYQQHPFSIHPELYFFRNVPLENPICESDPRLGHLEKFRFENESLTRIKKIQNCRLNLWLKRVGTIIFIFETRSTLTYVYLL